MDNEILFCFDSNTLMMSDKDIESFDEFYLRNISELKEFLDKNNLVEKILLLIPETVISELETHKKEKLERWFKEMNNYCNNLSKIKDAKKILNTINVSEHLIELKKVVLENYEVISLPNDTKKLFEETYQRSLLKTAPFKKGNSDQGFKDCIIYLSLIEYAKNYNDANFYFFSKDKGFIENDSKLFLEKEFKTETNNTLIIKDTNDFLGVCKEIFNLDIEINDTIVKTIIPFIENEFSNFKKIIIDDNEFQIKEMEINPEETIQQDLGENLDITFSFIIKYLDSNKITEINDLCKTISINKKTKRFEVVKNYNYEVLE